VAYQDGGMSDNCPNAVAIAQFHGIRSGISRPDIVVSIGTGTVGSLSTTSSPAYRSRSKDGAVRRVLTGFNKQFDGERAWVRHKHLVPPDERKYYHRLNVTVPEAQMSLDNAAIMDELSDLVRRGPETALNCWTIVSSLLVASFFFELDRIPGYEDGHFICKGRLRSAIPGPTLASAFTHVHPAELWFTKDEETLGQCRPVEETCSQCQRYQKPVEFAVHHRNDLISIFANSMSFGRQRISACPRTCQQFVEDQQLEACFGRAIHGDFQQVFCTSCQS
jgi:hypothetical protein